MFQMYVTNDNPLYYLIYCIFRDKILVYDFLFCREVI